MGLAVGGLINAFDSRSSRNQIAEATAELASLPRSREEAVYRPYVFERYVVRAQKQAVVPVSLLDSAGRTLRSTDLRQREMREFFMLRGLDPRDRDYEQHRSSSMTRAELARWTRTPPALRLSSVAAALIDGGPQGDAFATGAPAARPVAPSVPPLGPDLYDLPDADPARDPGRDLDGPWRTDDREDELVAWGADPHRDLAYADPGDPLGDPPLDDGLGKEDLMTLSAPERAAPEAGPVGFDLADLKSARRADPAVSGPHAASVVRIDAGSGSGNGAGFYVREDLVLTAYDVVREASVVDVTTADGATVPALVASVDPARELALVQVPRPGPAVALYPGNDPPAVRPVGAGAGASGRPLFVGDEVVGMTTRAGGDRTGVVTIDAIRAFVDGAAGGLPVLP